jgi:DeoR/GlpR family transcriptional regulator of sugar metabolism
MELLMLDSFDQAEKDGLSSRTQRQERIAEYVLSRSFVRIQELTDLFKVSLMTIHRDLDELEAQGILRKVRGGATALPSSLFESDVRYRLNVAVREKEAIARLAASLIEPGQAVLLDASTTTLALSKLLPRVGPLTVITNCLSILQELSKVRGIRLIVLGGDFLPHHDAFAGLLTEQAIMSLHADLLFMSVPALSGNIIYHPEEELVKVKRAMLASANKRILLLDHTKFGKTALHRLAALQEFDRVIVDAGVEEAQLNELREAHVPVDIAPLEEPSVSRS